MADGTVRELPGTGSVALRGQVVVCSDAQGYVVAVFERSEVSAWGAANLQPELQRLDYAFIDLAELGLGETKPD